jgi:hypothetical protein
MSKANYLHFGGAKFFHTASIVYHALKLRFVGTVVELDGKLWAGQIHNLVRK